MAFRFWRRIRLAPGVTLNLSKSTASLSLGPRGAKYTVSPRGSRATFGLPGTGLFYTVKPDGASVPRPRSVPQRDRLSMSFLQRLVTPAGEKAFVDGLRAFHEGREDAALEQLEAAADLPDAAWLAGMLRLRREDLQQAERHLKGALDERLGTLYEKYGVGASMDLPVTHEVTAYVSPEPRSTLLALAELYQQRGEPAAARDALTQLLQRSPDDAVAKASLAELLLDERPPEAGAVVQLTAGIENETPVHTALLLYKGRALRLLGLHDAAIAALTAAFRRRKDRAPGLLREVRYERALSYEAAGRSRRARKELEAIYADAPDFEDVATRLGIGGAQAS